MKPSKEILARAKKLGPAPGGKDPAPKPETHAIFGEPIPALAEKRFALSGLPMAGRGWLEALQVSVVQGRRLPGYERDARSEEVGVVSSFGVFCVPVDTSPGRV